MLLLYWGFDFIFNSPDFQFGNLHREKGNPGHHWLMPWTVPTGHGSREERDEVSGHPLLLKPFVPEDLTREKWGLWLMWAQGKNSSLLSLCRNYIDQSSWIMHTPSAMRPLTQYLVWAQRRSHKRYWVKGFVSDSAGGDDSVGDETRGYCHSGSGDDNGPLIAAKT